MEQIKIVKEELLSDNWYSLKKYTYEILKKDGSSKQQMREVYDRGNGAAILLYNALSLRKILQLNAFKY
jgi:GDP-mannose pyrophosphatase NudK